MRRQRRFAVGGVKQTVTMLRISAMMGGVAGGVAGWRVGWRAKLPRYAERTVHEAQVRVLGTYCTAGSGHGQGDQVPRGECKYMERVGVSGRAGYRWKALGELFRSYKVPFEVTGVPQKRTCRLI